MGEEEEAEGLVPPACRVPASVITAAARRSRKYFWSCLLCLHWDCCMRAMRECMCVYECN